MSDRENEPFDLEEPPDASGGPQNAADALRPQKPVPVDPPDGGGGTDG